MMSRSPNPVAAAGWTSADRVDDMTGSIAARCQDAGSSLRQTAMSNPAVSDCQLPMTSGRPET